MARAAAVRLIDLAPDAPTTLRRYVPKPSPIERLRGQADQPWLDAFAPINIWDRGLNGPSLAEALLPWIQQHLRPTSYRV